MEKDKQSQKGFLRLVHLMHILPIYTWENLHVFTSYAGTENEEEKYLGRKKISSKLF